MFFLESMITSIFCNECKQALQNRYIQTDFGGRSIQNQQIHVCALDKFPLIMDSSNCGNCEDSIKIQSMNTRIIPNNAFVVNNNYIKIGEIYMEDVHLQDLSSAAFTTMNYLREIHLSRNDLTTIKDGVFSSLPALEIIDLSMNKIRNLSRYFLTGTTNLKMLNLSCNLLIALDMFAINSANQLVLDLSFNNLTSFQFEHAAGKLDALNLSHNLLHEINDCFPTFRVTNLMNNNLTSLTDVSCFTKQEGGFYLNLGFNSLSELKPGLFDKLTRLEYLYIDQNNLSSLPTNIFAGLHSLKVLNISHNHLKELQHGLFEHLEELTTLDISHNELSDIISYIHSLRTLNELMLQNNRLDTLDSRELLRDLPDLTRISFDGNVFSCGELIEIFRDLRLRKVFVPYGDTKSVDNIHGIACYENKSVSTTQEYESSIRNKVEQLLFEKLAFYAGTKVKGNSSLTDDLRKGFKDSGFYDYLKKLEADRAYRFNESEFVNYFNKDFKNSTFYKYLEHLRENEIAVADLNRSFYDYFNKDFKNSSFIKYFENMRKAEEVFNEDFLKSKMFNFFNRDFQNSKFYKYMAQLITEAGPLNNTDISTFEKLVGNIKDETVDSHGSIIVVFLVILILIMSFLALVVFRIYVIFSKTGIITQEQVELINT